VATEPDRRLHTAGEPVPGEWVDYNGHVLDACYLLAFAPATTALLEALELGERYREATGCTIYTVECHVRYLRELHAGDVPYVDTQLLGFDQKRIHAHHTLARGDGAEPAATCELLFLHVNQASGRVEPLPDEARARVAALHARHAALPLPAATGRGIRLERLKRRGEEATCTATTIATTP
jgi:acyl-CoA thioester hydrolase